ncbi:MAG: cob(I)yrinic acid a,c-diamide adenosyltransferase [Halarsenatibacteraceae bacterium]
MKIYTKTGDKGETSLYDNTRVAKDSIRVESYGTIDELNSTLGLARTFISDEEISKAVFKIQRQLFDVAGELATSDGTTFPEKIGKPEIEELEDIIDRYLAEMNEEEKSSFIIPGSNRASAALHQARTICRRGERRIVTLGREAEIREEIQKYVNRLSDVIYTLARFLETRLEYVEFNKDA